MVVVTNCQLSWNLVATIACSAVRCWQDTDDHDDYDDDHDDGDHNDHDDDDDDSAQKSFHL